MSEEPPIGRPHRDRVAERINTDSEYREAWRAAYNERMREVARIRDEHGIDAALDHLHDMVARGDTAKQRAAEAIRRNHQLDELKQHLTELHAGMDLPDEEELARTMREGDEEL